MSDELRIDEIENLANKSQIFKETISPEEKFFHSVYISGVPRINHLGITENPGKFQIRGVDYNLDSVNLIILNTQDILVKMKKGEGGRMYLDCFSFKDGFPWKGTNGRICPKNTEGRAADPFCRECKGQIIVSGLYVDESGKPILSKYEKNLGQPLMIFMRGKGIKYEGLNTYLQQCYRKEYPDRIVSGDDPIKIKNFEKRIVNPKRVVTNVTMGTRKTKFGTIAYIFILNEGIQLPKKTVLEALRLANSTFHQFVEEFDWSKRENFTGGFEEDNVFGINESPSSKQEEDNIGLENIKF